MGSKKCAAYGHIMKNLSRSQVKAIFWVLFVTVLVMLTTATSAYNKSTRHATHIRDAELHPTISQDICQNRLSRSKEKSRRRQIRCIVVCFFCLLVAIVCTVFEAFAALTLQFCHGLDLAFLYWPFWGFLQVGSTIAILGITAVQTWALVHGEPLGVNAALGTPVLVVAWLGQAFEHLFRGLMREQPVKSFETFVNEHRASPSETAPETRTRIIPGNELIGFDVDGRPLIAVKDPSRVKPFTARLIGKTEDDRSIYIYGATPASSSAITTSSSSGINSLVSASNGNSGQQGRARSVIRKDVVQISPVTSSVSSPTTSPFPAFPAFPASPPISPSSRSSSQSTDESQDKECDAHTPHLGRNLTSRFLASAGEAQFGSSENV